MEKIRLHKVKTEPVSGLFEVKAYFELINYVTDQNGRILLSSIDCISTAEVCARADALIRNLEDIKREAAKIKWLNHPDG
jgi:hypothetical protein